MSESSCTALVCFYVYLVSIFSNTACSVAGITSDANVLTAYLRQVAQG